MLPDPSPATPPVTPSDQPSHRPPDQPPAASPGVPAGASPNRPPADQPPLVGLDDIRAAARRIAGTARRTPLVATTLGEAGTPLLLKCENLQLGGSFKLRGAACAIAMLTPQERARGVITHSSGNHAQAVARAARDAGIRATVVMPHSAPEVKRRATADLGARIVPVDPADRAATADRLAAESGAVFVPPYDDPRVIAGQGTVGLEIAEDRPDLSTVFVPVSGGGLVSGIAVAVKALCPDARVVAVEPELAGDLAEGWRSGERATWSAARTGQTIADGLRVTTVGDLPWRHIQAYVDDVVTVSEDQIRDAVRRLLLEAKLVCEPSGAVAVAGALASAPRPARGPVVAVLSGGNVEPTLLRALLAE